MPIYDYKCRDCGNEFDELAAIGDPPPKECPACHCGNVFRMISGTFGKVEMGSREYFKNVLEPEAKKIAEKIKGGDEDALADIIGEDKMGKK